MSNVSEDLNSSDGAVNMSVLDAVPIQEVGDLQMAIAAEQSKSLVVRKNLGQVFDRATSVADQIKKYEAKTNKNDEEIPIATPAELGVYLRLRPLSDGATNTLQIIHPNKNRSLFTVRAHAPETSFFHKTAQRPGDTMELLTKEYDFSHVFDDTASQETVYRQTLLPFLEGVSKKGQSALLFCYGMTNAGKTYTVTGPEKGLLEQKATLGLVPRALRDLCHGIEKRHTPNQSLHLSYFEIYNERVRDLLPTKQLMTKSDAAMGLAFKGLAMHKIRNVQDGLELIVEAKKNRKSGTNRINNDSSRSHAVCQLRITTKDSKGGEKHSDLWIVDLAGSERSKRTGGGRQQEASNINTSLMTLNRCLTALRINQERKNSTMIPWRESKLTHLFAAHWMGPFASRTGMVVNVHPSVEDFDETQHVLAFATEARTVSLQPSSDNNGSLVRATNGVEYGYDGRRVKHPPPQNMVQKVAKAIRKLSPKRMLKRKADVTASDPPMKEDGKPSVKKMKTTSDSHKVPSVQGNPAAVDDATKEIQALKMSLAVAHAETAVLRTRNQELEAQMEALETDVRNEVAEEMEEQMHTMRSQYESMLENLRSRVHDDQSEAEKSQRDQAHAEIASLKEQVAECEDEMKRMRNEYEQEVSEWRNKYESTLSVDQQVNVKNWSEEVVAGRDREEIVVQEVGVCDEEEDGIHDEDCDIHEEEDENSEEVCSGEAVDSGEKNDTKSDDSNNDTTDDDEEEDESPLGQDRRVTRLQIKWKVPVKIDANNVVVIDDSDDEENENLDESDDENEPEEEAVGISTKDRIKSERSETKQRSPLRPVVNPRNSSAFLGEDSDGSFGPEKWLKPNKALRKDPSTGTFLRPRGRKPKDAEYWDEKRGAWRVSRTS